MIDTLYQDSIDKSLDDQIQRPKPLAPPPPPGFSLWQLAKSPVQGVGSGLSEGAAFMAETTGAFGQVLGATDGSSQGMFSTGTEKEQKERLAASNKMVTQGIEMSNQVGDTFRAQAKDMMPDPATTHTSAQVVAGLANFATKAVGYTATLGPAGPLALGGDVALTESDRLKQQGVDLETRSKAGAVAGTLAAASVVVPMSGATRLTRFAKGVAVGEGTIVGQSLAEKAILKDAGYDKISDSFDPLDPVALALGVVPGVLGAKFGHAPEKVTPAAAPRSLFDMGLPERQALKFNDVQLDAYAIKAAQREGIPPEILLAIKNAGERSGSTATSPKGAQGVMQFMPDTFKRFGKGDPTDPLNSIDAGAKYMKYLYETYGDWDAAIAHYNGGGSQAALVRSGARPSFPETAKYLDNVKAYLGKTLDDHTAAAVAAEPDLVAAARVQQAANALHDSALTTPDDIAGLNIHLDAVQAAADQLGRGERVTVNHLFGDDMLANMHESRTIDDHIQALQDQRAALLGDAGNLMEPGAVRDLRTQLDALKAQAPDSSAAAVKARAKEIQAEGGGYKAALTKAQKEMAQMVADHTASVQRLVDQLDSHARAAQAQEQLAPLDRQIAEAQQARETMPGPRTSPKALALALSDAFGQRSAPGMLEAPRPSKAAPKPEVSEPQPSAIQLLAQEAAGHLEENKTPANVVAKLTEAGKTVSPELNNMLIATHQLGDKVPDLVKKAEEISASNPKALPHDVIADALDQVKAESAAEKPAQAAIDRAAAEVSMLNPDLLVQLDGMEAPVRVGDLLEQVKREADEEVRDSKLVEVAATCALRN